MLLVYWLGSQESQMLTLGLSWCTTLMHTTAHPTTSLPPLTGDLALGLLSPLHLAGRLDAL